MEVATDLSALEIRSTTSCTWIVDNFTTCSKYVNKYFSLLDDNNSTNQFRLDLYPNGSDSYLKNFVMIRLLCIASSKETDNSNEIAQYKLSILNNSGERWQIQEGQLIPSNAHFPQLNINRDYLLDKANNLLSNDDKLTIHCELFIYEKNQNSRISSLVVLERSRNVDVYDGYRKNVPGRNVLEDRAKPSDVLVIVQDKQFHLHKHILSSKSLVFEKLFTQQNQIELTDIKVEVFEELLRFIYTGSIPSFDAENQQNILELFTVADRYKLEELKQLCEKSINLTIETVSEILELADQNNGLELKAKCIEFIRGNSNDVMNTESWKQLLKSGSNQLMLEMYQLMDGKFASK